MADEQLEPSSGAGNLGLQKISRFLVWLFAAFGFVASIVTIAQYFSADHSQLQVRLMPQKALIQSTLLDVAAEGKEPGLIRAIVRSNKDFFCKGANELRAEKSPDVPIIEKECDKFYRLDAVADLLKLYDGTSIVLLQYDVKNTGDTVAQGIRLSGKGVSFADSISDSNNRRRLEADKDGFYGIPDLNPQESMRVLAWSGGAPFAWDNEYVDAGDFPKITFRGRSVGTTLLVPTPKFYFDMYDTLSSFPLVVSVLLVLAICFVVGMVILLVIAIVGTLVQGKPLKTVFATQSDSNEKASSVVADSVPDRGAE